MARRKTMITMGSPYFVWINTNEIISSWYLLGAVCVAPLPGLRGEALRQRLLAGIRTSKLVNVQFGDLMCTDFSSASGWSAEEQDVIERCGITNTLRLVSDGGDEDIEKIDWGGCKHVDGEVLQSLAGALKYNSSVQKINLCRAGGKLDETADTFDQKYKALYDGLMALEAVLDTNVVKLVKLDEDPGWAEFAGQPGQGFEVPKAAIAQRCARNEERQRVYDASLAINRPFQFLLLVALHTRGSDHSNPLVQMPEFPPLSMDLLELIADEIDEIGDVPCDASPEAKARGLFWPDDGVEGEPIQTVDFAWHEQGGGERQVQPERQRKKRKAS
jgi:hypothetical protein